MQVLDLKETHLSVMTCKILRPKTVPYAVICRGRLTSTRRKQSYLSQLSADHAISVSTCAHLVSKWLRANYLANNHRQLFATVLDWFFSCRHTDLRQLLPPSPAQPQRRYSPPGHSPQNERTVCLVLDLTCESMCLEFSSMWDIVP